MIKVKVTSDQLWSYARKYADKKEKAGMGTQYPTMRQATKRFKCKIDDIQDAVDDACFNDKYLGLAVAYGVSGFGSFEIEHRGNYEIEAY